MKITRREDRARAGLGLSALIHPFSLEALRKVVTVTYA